MPFWPHFWVQIKNIICVTVGKQFENLLQHLEYVLYIVTFFGPQKCHIALKNIPDVSNRGGRGGGNMSDRGGRGGGASGGREFPPDWECPRCHKVNFARRTTCFQCGLEKPLSDTWTCPRCKQVNPLTADTCSECHLRNQNIKKKEPEVQQQPPAIPLGGKDPYQHADNSSQQVWSQCNIFILLTCMELSIVNCAISRYSDLPH